VALVDLGFADGSSGASLARRLIDRCHLKTAFVTAGPTEVGSGSAGSVAVIAKPLTDESIRAGLAMAGRQADPAH